MATSQAGIDAAYATEINNCSFRADAGPRKSARPQEFCASVEVQGDVTLNANLTVGAVATFGAAIVVAGETFRPQLVLIPGVGFLSILVSDTTPVVGVAPAGSLSANVEGRGVLSLSIDDQERGTNAGIPILLNED